MPAAFTSVLPARGRCLSARSRRVIPFCSNACWIESSKRICSGVAFAVLLQLSGTPDCARASDDTVTVPRGALEELLLRDLSHRIHEMDSDSLSSFMQNLKGLTAPDPRAERPMDSKATTGSQSSTGKSSQTQAASTPSPTEPDPRERQDVRATPALPSAVPAQAPGQQPDKQNAAAVSAAVEPPPQAPSDPVYSIFRGANASGSPSPSDDLTAQLLGLRSSPDDPRPLPGKEPITKETQGPQEAWLGILGLPLAVWTTLDKVLPPELRSTSGEVLTEEVQRAVYVVKGLVLVASSALAYFLSRALLAQLRSALLGFPLAQQALRAAESTAEAARQAQPQLRQRAAALLSRFPGGSDRRPGRESGALGQEEAEQMGGAPAVASDVLQRQREEGARDMGGDAATGNGGRPRPPGGAPPPPPLVPTASGALYTAAQGGPNVVQRRRRVTNVAPASAGPVRDVAGKGLGLADAVPLPVIDEVEILSPGSAGGGPQRSGGAAAAAGEGPGGGVLWKRAGSRQASKLSSRWDGAGADRAATSDDPPGDSSSVDGDRPAPPSPDAKAPPGGADGRTSSAGRSAGTARHVDVGRGLSDTDHVQIDSGFGISAGKSMVGNAARAAGAEKDPWFG